uniref:Uncharacterized protein n=1 Tax=Siphoviridae sp. ctwQT14 TaxID=2827971 RepID=A0A8S5TKS5_9CAUD|nr:MAG TPA: hypothetical protein [Siphoviridae sp. ctwQT14]
MTWHTTPSHILKFRSISYNSKQLKSFYFSNFGLTILE